MRLSVEDPFVQAHDPRLTEQQVEIFERLREPEALHGVIQVWRSLRHVVDGRVPVWCFGVLVDGFEHAPAGFAPVAVTGDAVHVPHRFDGFGSTTVVSAKDASGRAPRGEAHLT